MLSVLSAPSPPDRSARLRNELRGDVDRTDPLEAARQLRALVRVDERSKAEAKAVRAGEVDGVVRVHEAMRRLRACASPNELIAAASRELCAACGFSRAMLSQVHGRSWAPLALAPPATSGPEAERFASYADGLRVPLDHLLLETELVRRRLPALVEDPGNDPRTYGPLVAASGSSSYVVAPIVPTRWVIGLFHADRLGQDRPCDEHDRDMLWAFAEHFGLLFERAVLVERLEEQRAHLQQAFREAAQSIQEVNDAELALVRRGPLTDPSTPGSCQRGIRRVDALLTKREQEVVELLASGATNAEIGQQLVISAGTVKSHVKRILRKLHVANRTEVVVKYLQLQRLDAEGAP